MIIWKNIKFINKEKIDIELDILKQSLITVPAAPAFVENEHNTNYWSAIRAADYNILDSSLFTLLCRIKGFKVYKYSGYRLINDLINYLKVNCLKVLLIDPTDKSSEINKYFIINNTKLQEKDIESYIAPMYPVNSEIKDYKLLQRINNFKPDLVMINIAGGKQEILGAWLKNNQKKRSTIICTGAAIAFFTGEQVSLSSWIDKIYLGWFMRVINNPKVFLPRYINAFKLVPIFIKDSNLILKEK